MRYFLEFNKYFNQFKQQRNMNLTESVGNSPDYFVANIDNSINLAKIFKISDSIKKLLLLTKVPKVNDKIHLPYPYVFIDVNFTKKELEMLGLTIKYDEIIGILVSEGVMRSEKEQKLVGTDLRITIVSKISKEYAEEHNIKSGHDIWFDTFNENVNITNKEHKSWGVTIQRVDSTDVNSRKLTYNFFLAFLNFINNPEIKVIEVEYNKDSNLKRIKKGKIPIPNRYVIELNGVMKKYISDLETSGSFELNHRFWVRGHFRTLRDEERYGENVGRKIWIMPFVKGKGVLVEKEYIVQDIK